MCNIDLGIIGTWIGSLGTCVTGIALAVFAYKQNKINERQSEINQKSQKIEIALRYQSHYIRLSELIEKFNSDLGKYVNPVHIPDYVEIEPMQEAKQNIA